MFTACGIKHRRCCSIVGALYRKLQTQSSAPEDGRNYRPKHVELIELINKIIKHRRCIIPQAVNTV